MMIHCVGKVWLHVRGSVCGGVHEGGRMEEAKRRENGSIAILGNERNERRMK